MTCSCLAKRQSGLFVSAHPAKNLQTTNPDVFISSDGGYSWRKVSFILAILAWWCLLPQCAPRKPYGNNSDNDNTVLWGPCQCEATCVLLSLLFQQLCETESQRRSPKGKSLMRAQVHLSHQIIPGLWIVQLVVRVQLHCPVQVSPGLRIVQLTDCENPAPLPSSDLPGSA